MNELEEIRTARGSLQKFRMKLLQPSAETLESGSADLEIAVECLRRIEPVLAARAGRSASSEWALGAEVADLRGELKLVNALLEGAGNFYQGWARLLGCGMGDEAANYTANGQPGASISSESKKVVIHG